MTAPNPKKWFPSPYTAQINWRKVDKWAEYQKGQKPYFDTWEEAHAQAMAWAARAIEKAGEDAAKAKRAIKAAAVRAQKVAALRPPDAAASRHAAAAPWLA